MSSLRLSNNTPPLPSSSSLKDTLMKEEWVSQPLTVFVCGASGDLAKKKTYPALLDLFRDGALAKETIIIGYARSKLTDKDLREKLEPWLLKHAEKKIVDQFLKICFYQSGQYNCGGDFSKAVDLSLEKHGLTTKDLNNRVFYFALPPNAFLDMAQTVHDGGIDGTGFRRLILEKPFGHDTESAIKLGNDLGKLFSEDYLYRIDHYLGKEMVQNVITLRFANSFLEPIWNRDHISSVTISFKEDIGTQGRGGYFDNYGIIRDVMQNHLMQVLCVIAMEPPVRVAGKNYSNFVRDEKVKVLKCIEPWTLDNCVLGQYVGGNGEPGYLEDDTVPKGSNQPTYAAVVMNINNQRWDGVPFIMKAGKALDQRRAEIRIQLKTSPGSNKMFDSDNLPRNELVIRLQPDEAIYMKTNVKAPGLKTTITQSEMDLTYSKRYEGVQIYDAYTRLVLDVLRGKQATFVRDDELEAAWEIVTPLLNEIEKNGAQPLPYKFGSRGPKEADEMIKNVGYQLNPDYASDYLNSKKSLPKKFI